MSKKSFGRTKVFLESNLTLDEIQAIAGVEQIKVHEDQSFEITLNDPEAGKVLFTAATKDGYIPMFNQQPPTLEEIFKQKVGERHA